MAEREEDFLRRWSRRKAEARQGLRPRPSRAPAAPTQVADEGRVTARGEAAAPPTGSSAGADAPLAACPPEQTIDEKEFADVDFDKLDFNSDYTRFMRKGVPAAIQRRALRALWRSDPVLACVDGLNDYDLDYTDAATVVKDLKTTWQIGRGYLTEEEIAARDAKTRAAAGEGACEAAQDASAEAEPARAEAGGDGDDRARSPDAGEDAARAAESADATEKPADATGKPEWRSAGAPPGEEKA